jgi:putative phosphonate metabolism protein
MDEQRFAIYFVPPRNSRLYRFGTEFLGHDCYSGAALNYPADVELGAEEWAELTRAPRQYGFHATLKAPFHLLPPCTESDLIVELHQLATVPRACAEIEPAIRSLGGFIAIVARKDSPEVDRLAADCVRAFDRFRRPLTAQERARRLVAGLSTRQIEYLERWGYPFVFDEFRFHMTLTGPVAAERRCAIVSLLANRFGRVNGDRSLPITRLALVRQDGRTSPFRVVGEAELAVIP